MKAYLGLIRALAVVSSVVVLFLALSITVGAVSRYGFSRSLAWVTELSTYALLYIAFLAAPWVLHQDGHVKVDFLNYFLSPRRQAALDTVASSVSAVLTASLTWMGVRAVYQSYLAHEVVANILQTPIYLLTWVIPVGMALLTVGFVHRACTSRRTNEEPPGARPTPEAKPWSGG
ncbi:MAG: TRAP transporter small permease [Moorellales bacterium]